MKHSMLHAPAAGAWLALAGVLGAAFLWAVLPADWLDAFLDEGGPVEAATAVLHFLVALAVWLLRRPDDDWRMTLALSVLFAAFGARELDLHKAWTDTSVLKVSFYLRDAPLLHKLVALPAVLATLAAAVFVLVKGIRPFVRGLRRGEPACVTAACFIATMVVSKVFDRSINILAEDFGMRFSQEVDSFVTSFEETLELFLPLLAVLGLAQHRAPGPAAPRR
jgi:hypothetical protein